MLAPVNTAREIVASEQLGARDFFVRSRTRAAPLRYPGASRSPPAKTVRDPPARAASRRAHGRVLAGSGSARCDVERLRAEGVVERPLRRHDDPRVRRAGAAGPIATLTSPTTAPRSSGRVAAPSRLPALLRLTPTTPGGLDGSAHFAVLNVNKLSVALDLSRPEASPSRAGLALSADAVAENFRARRDGAWGLDYASLVQARPDLVMISTCLNGQTGPHRHYPGFRAGRARRSPASTTLTGWPDASRWVRSAPHRLAVAALTPRCCGRRLLHRRRTGEGQHIDLSQVEAGSFCLTESNPSPTTANGELLARMGNRFRATRAARRSSDAPTRNGRGPLGGHRRARRRGLGSGSVGVLGRPAWAFDSELARRPAASSKWTRWSRRLEAWTRRQAATDVAVRLQTAGLDAAVVEDFGDLTTIRSSRTGDTSGPSSTTSSLPPRGAHAIRFSAMEPQLDAPAPCLGAHTEYVTPRAARHGAGGVRPAAARPGCSVARP